MNLVDANVLLYAVNEADAKHEEAREWLDAALGGLEAVGFAWTALLAFIRLSTKVGLFPNPLPVHEAFAVVRDWTEQPSRVIVEPTPRHLELLSALLLETGTGPRRRCPSGCACPRVQRHDRHSRHRLHPVPRRAMAPSPAEAERDGGAVRPCVQSRGPRTPTGRERGLKLLPVWVQIPPGALPSAQSDPS